MTKKKSLKDKSSKLVQSSTFRLPGSAESNNRVLHTVRGEIYESIAEVLRVARSRAYRAVNFVMVEAYWRIGRMIVDEEQQGKEKAEYGDYLLRQLAGRLTNEFGKGFAHTNLKYIRQFYLTYPIGHAVRDQLGSADGSQEPIALRDSSRHKSSQDHNRLSSTLRSAVALQRLVIIVGPPGYVVAEVQQITDLDITDPQLHMICRIVWVRRNQFLKCVDRLPCALKSCRHFSGLHQHEFQCLIIVPELIPEFGVAGFIRH
jgi:uncharacterized protein DUF1016